MIIWLIIANYHYINKQSIRFILKILINTYIYILKLESYVIGGFGCTSLTLQKTYIIHEIIKLYTILAADGPNITIAIPVIIPKPNTMMWRLRFKNARWCLNSAFPSALTNCCLVVSENIIKYTGQNFNYIVIILE